MAQATTTTVTAAGTLARLLKTTTAQTEKYIKKCPENRRFAQIAPGKATPIWLVGHLACVADFLGNTLGLGKKGILPKEYRQKFMPVEFGGVPITANAADYPAWDEVVANYKQVMASLAEGASQVPDEELLGPTKSPTPEPLKEMLTCLQDALALHIVHDSHHRGQLALILGKPE
jgi:hypothetical protein